LLVFAVSQV